MNQLMEGVEEARQLAPMPRKEPLRQEMEDQHLAAGQNWLRMKDEIDIPMEAVIGGTFALCCLVIMIIGMLIKRRNKDVSKAGVVKSNSNREELLNF